MATKIYVMQSASESGLPIPGKWAEIPVVASTATEFKILGFDTAGAFCVWTWHVGAAAPVSTPVAGDLAYSVIPEEPS